MSVVHLKQPHTLYRGGGMEKKIGNTTITFDFSKELAMTDEERARRKEKLEEACWMIADELLARGETA